MNLNLVGSSRPVAAGAAGAEGDDKEEKPKPVRPRVTVWSLGDDSGDHFSMPRKTRSHKIRDSCLFLFTLW